MGYKQYREEWKRLYLCKQMSTTEIADEYGCSQNTVSRHLRAIGVSFRGSSGSKYVHLREKWAELYRSGTVVTEIAKRYDCTPTSVYDNLKAAGVDTSGHLGRTDLERVLEKTKVRTEKECWIWTGAMTGAKNNRPIFSVDGYPRFVSRWIYEHFTGHTLGPLWCLHRCHNGKCVNPAHLYAGTAKQNSKDRCEAGNTPKGESHSNSKLTKKEVQKIKGIHSEEGIGKNGRWATSEIASKYGVSNSAIRSVVSGKSWTHIKA